MPHELEPARRGGSRPVDIARRVRPAGLPGVAGRTAAKPAVTGSIEAGMMNLSRTQMLVSWGLQLLVAGILLQTLFFKFTGAEESVYIFSTLGAEPWGRIGSGVVELVAALLLLVPALAPYGALLTMATMTGAIASHLLFLGIEVKGDGGLLFGLALIAFVSSACVLLLRRAQLPLPARFFEAM